MGIFDRFKKKNIAVDHKKPEEPLALSENVLYLTRFCGVEQYPIQAAAWHLIAGDGTEDDPDTLCLDITCKAGNSLHEDTAQLEAEPIWSICFQSVHIPVSALQPGFCLEQPNPRGDTDGNLYYTEHQPTTDNRMEIIEADGARLKIRLNGITQDVNFYDGSKPQNILQLTAWFDRE